MKGWAIAYLHILPREFGELRLPEFWSAMDAWSEDKVADRRHAGELARGAALRLWNLQVKDTARITDPAKFWPMPWDEVPESPAEVARQISQLSQEERDAMAHEFLNRIKDGK